MDLTNLDTGWLAAIAFLIAWGAKEFIAQLKKRGIDLPLISKNSEKSIQKLDDIGKDLDSVIAKINEVFKDDDRLVRGFDQMKDTLSKIEKEVDNDKVEFMLTEVRKDLEKILYNQEKHNELMDLLIELFNKYNK